MHETLDLNTREAMTNLIERLTPFLNSLTNTEAWTENEATHDAVVFLQYAIELLESIVSGAVPLDMASLAYKKFRDIQLELASIGYTNTLSAKHRFLMSQVFHAIIDMVETAMRGYATAAREPDGMYALDLDMTPTSMAELQRTYTVAMQDHTWSFIREHPEYPVCAQTLVDWVHTIQASDQSTHSAFVDYQRAKTIFYEQYENMNETAPTTDSTVDIARAASIIREIITRRGDENPIRSVLMAGSGNMDRFEGPLLRLLQAEGIQFDNVAAVDRVDYRAHIDVAHPDLHVDFRKGDILDSSVFDQEQFDLVMFPWSVLCDILPRRDFIHALHTVASKMRPGGFLITDQAVPIGRSSYKRMQEEQSGKTGERGVFSRSFDGPDGQQLWSTFNIMDVTTLLRDAAQAGFIPCNMPETVQEQQSIVERIEANESEIIEQARQGTNLNAMENPIYQANGWNRMTLALEYVGQEEALRRAKAAPSLFHTLSLGVGEAKDGT